MGVLIDTVVPTIAVFLALAMWLSPCLAVIDCRKRGTLGTMNPLPFCAMLFSASGWTLYGYIKFDPFIAASNVPGVILGLLYILSSLQVLNRDIGRREHCLSGYDSKSVSSDFTEMSEVINSIQSASVYTNKHEEDKSNVLRAADQQQEKEKLCKLVKQSDGIIFYTALTPVVWSTLGTIAWCGLEGESTAQLLLGITCFIAACFYFGSPLSTMLEVIADKDSSSIYPPMIVANTVNCTLWILYGALAVHDTILWSINAVGFFLAFLNAVLLVIYPRTRAGNFCATGDPSSSETKP